MKIIRDAQLEAPSYKEADVKNIVNLVKNKGDKAILRLTEKYDGVIVKKLEITRDGIDQAYKSISPSTVSAIKKASKNITRFARAQMKQFKNFEIEIKKGVNVGQLIVPIEKIGIYIPGGNFPLPSSVLMAAIPAKVAGVKEIIMCSLPRYKGSINPVTLVAADICGINRIFKIGGAQAIAAMAYGTKTVPRVDKIIGPGNKYIIAAKKQVYGDVGIDFLAGPSEILIIADKTANPKFIASDLLAQAEHDIEAKAILVTNSERLAYCVNKEVEKQITIVKTKKIAEQSLKKNGRIIIVKTIENAIEFANRLAPEHLELQIKEPKKYLSKLNNYGSLFLGSYSANVLEDYVTGTNHILPTGSSARFTAGLSVKDFIKLQTYQYVNKKGFDKILNTAIRMADIEGLDGHKKALELRKWSD